MEPGTIIRRVQKIGTADFPSLVIALPTLEGQLTEFTVFDDRETTRKSLEKVNESWDLLWPKLEALLREGITDYETNQSLQGEGFRGTFDFLDEPGAFMNDESDCQIGFHFEIDVPGWDAFIKGAEVVHFQPIF